jgi:hypothetical protein
LFADLPRQNHNDGDDDDEKRRIKTFSYLFYVFFHSPAVVVREMLPR